MKSFWKNKRVLVTGGSGIIGIELNKLLSKAGAKIISIDKKKQVNPKIPRVEWIINDLSKMDPAKLRKIKPEVVFHLAASFERSKESKGFWQTNWQDNLINSHNIVNLAAERHVKIFVFASSYLIYDPNQYLTSRKKGGALKLKETSPVNPRNITGAAKYYAEKELEFVNEYINPDLRVINARIFRVYGRGSKDIISRWVKSMLNHKAIKTYGEDNLFDYIYSADAAKGLMALAETKNAKGVINLGHGRSYQIKTVLKILTSLLGKQNNKTVRLKNLEKYERSGADISKLNKLTGWRPEVSLLEGIKKVIEFEKEK